MLKLNVEIGRYTSIPREERVCRCCLMNVIEDEYHFTLVCPAYRQFRFKYLPSQYCSWPNINEFVTLLRTKSRNTLYKIICFLKDSWRLRTQLIV